MSDLEMRMARIPLPEPPEPLRPRLLARARREHRWRTVQRVWRWALVTAAALLLTLNLQFGRAQEARLAALVQPPSIERHLDTKVLAQRLEHRQRLLIAWCSGDFPSELREEML